MILEDVSVEIAPSVFLTFQKVKEPAGFLFEGRFISADVLHWKLVKKQLELYQSGKISAVDFYTHAIERSYVEGKEWEGINEESRAIGLERHRDTEKVLSKISDIQRRELAKVDKKYNAALKNLNAKYKDVKPDAAVEEVERID